MKSRNLDEDAFFSWAEKVGLLGPKDDPPDCGRGWNNITDLHKKAFYAGLEEARKRTTHSEVYNTKLMAELSIVLSRVISNAH